MTTDDHPNNDDLTVDETDDETVTAEYARVDATQSPGDTDEMPALALSASESLDPDDQAIDEPRQSGTTWLQRNLVGVIGLFALLLLGSLILSGLMFAKVSSTQSELDETRAELATTREDMERVEAGAAIFASQVNGFVEQVNELGPSIDDGLDQAVTGLEDFGSSTIDFTVNIDENISIQQDFAIDRTIAVPINTSIPIDEEVETRITIDGPFGVDIPLNITVPIDLDVPIDLTVDIPINETIPIDVDVPVKLDVPISVDVKGTELENLTASLVEGLRAFQAGLGGLTGN